MGVPDVSTLAVVVKSSGISETSAQLSGLGTSAKNAETKVVSLTASVEKLMAVQKTATGAAMAYAQALSGAQQHLGGNQASTLGLETATAMLAKSMAALSASLQTVQAKSVQSRVAVQEHTAAMRDAHSVARGLAGGLGALWLTYGNVIPMVAGVALARGFMEAAKSGAEFAYQLKFVQGLGEETAATMERVSASILNISKGSMFSPVEMAQGMRVLSQAGLDAANALKVLPQAMDLAVVGEMAMEQASLTLVGVMNAFSLSVEDIPHIGDVFAKAAAVSQTSVLQMTEAMKSASVVGKQYGVSMEDAATAVAVLAKVNITGSAAGTSLKNMLKEMYAPGAEAAAMMKKLGVVTSESDGSLRKMSDVIFSLQDKLKEFDKISQTHILQRLFGERGAKEAIAMLAMTREEWDKLQGSIENSDGFMRKVSAQLEDTVKGKWTQAISTFQTSLQKAYESMAPTLGKMADALKNLFEDDSFIASLKQMVTGVSTFASILVEAAPIVIKLAEAFIVYKVAVIAASVATSAFLGVARVAAFFTGVGAAASTAAATLPLFSSTLVAVATGAASTVTGLTGIAGAASLLAGPIGIIAGLLVAGAGLWVIYGDKGSRALESLREDADKTKNSVDGINKAINDLSLGKVSGDVGMRAALNGYADLNKEVDAYEKKVKKYYGRDVSFDTDMRVKGQGAVSLSQLDGAGTKDEKVRAEIERSRLALIEKRIALDNLATVAAENRAAGEETLTNAMTAGNKKLVKEDKGAATDQWRADLLKIEGETESMIRRSKDAIASYVEMNKQGVIGDIELLKIKEAIEVNMHEQAIANLQKELNLQNTPEKRKAALQEIANLQQKHQDKIDGIVSASTEKQVTEVSKAEAEIQAAKVAGLKATGQYVAAFAAGSAALYDKEIEKLKADIESGMLSPTALAAWKAKLEAITKSREQALGAAGFKEADYAAQALIRTIEAGVAELEAKAQDGSLIGRLFAKEELAQYYEVELPKLAKKFADEEFKIRSDAEEKAFQTSKKAYYKMMEKQKDIYKDFINYVDSVGSEGFRALFDRTDGSWKSYVKKMKDSFKTYLIDEIYKLLARPFVMTILANIAGAAGMTGLQGSLTSAAQTGSGIGNMMSMGNSAYGLYTNGIAGTAGNYVSGFGNLVGSQGISAYGTGLQAAGAGTDLAPAIAAYNEAGMPLVADSLASGFAAGGGAAASTYGAGLSAAAGDVGLMYGGGEAAALGSNSGTLLGMGPAGWVALAVVAAYLILSKDGGGPKTEGDYFGTLGTDGTLTQSNTATGGSAFIDQNWYTAHNADASMAALAPAIGASIFQTVKDLGGDATGMGINFGYNTDPMGDAPDNVAAALTDKDGNYVYKHVSDVDRDTSGTAMSLEFQRMTLAAISAADGIPKIFKDIVSGIDLTTATAEQLTQTLADINSAVILREAFKTLNLNMDGLTVSLIQGAGGAAALTTKLQSYYQNFYSEEERRARSMTEMAVSFTDLGVAMPSTREGFRSLVEGLDLTTDAGRATFNGLMVLAGAFAELIPATDAANAATETAANAASNYAQALAQATSDNISATQAAFAAQKEAQRKMYEDQIKAAEDLAKTYDDLAKSLTDYRNSLLLGGDSSLSLADQYTLARSEFDKTSALAKGGDLTAAGNMQSVSDAFLAASKAVAPSADAYNADFGLVTSTLNSVISMAGIQSAGQQTIIAIANAQLSALDHLVFIADEAWSSGIRMVAMPYGVPSASIPAYHDGTGTVIPAFAAGGEHSGGWRRVGENGPEIEYTGPSQIISNQNSKALFDDSDIVMAIDTLRQEMQAANISIANSNQRVAKMVERWDGDGMPAVRDVAA